MGLKNTGDNRSHVFADKSSIVANKNGVNSYNFRILDSDGNTVVEQNVHVNDIDSLMESTINGRNLLID